MANPRTTPKLFCLLLLTVLLSGVKSIHAKSCSEGYPWITTNCDNEGNADQACWAECQRRHGFDAKADCRPGPGYPGGTYAYCECWYAC